ncbi:MAG: spore cortex biosynthesis protein YabQ [Eubacterium sp.]
MPEIVLQFLLSGFLMGVIYDISRFFRCLFPNKIAVFIFDLLFFAVFSLVFFTVLLAFNNGTVRAIYFTAYFTGLLIYIFTVFRLTKTPSVKTAALIRSLLKKEFKFFKKVLQSLKKVYYNVFMLSKKPLRKKSKAGSENESFKEFDEKQKI